MARKKFTKNDPDNVVNNIMQLKKEFRRLSEFKPFYHTQVYHNNGYYIYKVEVEYESAKVEFYEVFKEKIRKMITYENGKIVPTGLKKVAYPNDEDFGSWAWCVMTYERALKIIEEKS